MLDLFRRFRPSTSASPASQHPLLVPLPAPAVLAPGAPVVITVEALRKTFGRLEAVKGVSFTVARGEIFGILGPNGAGKTTTLECIEGIQPPTSGRAIVLGHETPKDVTAIKERIGVQLQSSAYYEYLTLTEILELFGRFYQRRVDPLELLAKVDLQEKARTSVGKLSGGQRQRFSIAATLVNDPEVIFLDEPTTGLDPQARRNLWDFIQRIHAEGRTVVLTTHYMEEAEFLCHRVAIMDHGRIVALDAPANLVRALRTPYELIFTVEPAVVGVDIGQLEGVISWGVTPDGLFHAKSFDTTQTLTALLAWAQRTGRRVQRLEVRPLTLEDVFLSITGRALRE